MFPPATCTKIYTAQPNIAHKYCTAMETGILHVFLKQHRDNIVHWATWLPHTLQVNCQYSRRTYSLMHQLSRYHLLANGEDRSFRLAIWPTFVAQVGNSPYIHYGTQQDFYPSPRTWRHYTSWPLLFLYIPWSRKMWKWQVFVLVHQMWS